MSVRVAAIAATVISGTGAAAVGTRPGGPLPEHRGDLRPRRHDDPGMGRVGSVLVDAIQPLVGNRTVTGYAVSTGVL